jgi:hypothetical protein
VGHWNFIDCIYKRLNCSVFFAPPECTTQFFLSLVRKNKAIRDIFRTVSWKQNFELWILNQGQLLLVSPKFLSGKCESKWKKLTLYTSNLFATRHMWRVANRLDNAGLVHNYVDLGKLGKTKNNAEILKKNSNSLQSHVRPISRA